MLIVNEKLINQTIKTSIGKIIVNKKGEAEVSQEVGEKAIKDYGFYEKGNKPQPKIEQPKKEVTDETAKERIAELEQKLLVVSQKLEKAEADLILSKDETESWKAEYTKIGALKDKGEKSEAEVEAGSKVQFQDNDINLIIDLWGKGVSELVELCKGLGLPENEWKELKKKELVVYLAKKTLNK